MATITNIAEAMEWKGEEGKEFITEVVGATEAELDELAEERGGETDRASSKGEI